MVLVGCNAGLPEDAKQVILKQYTNPGVANWYRNVDINLVGSGSTARTQYDQILCLKVTYEYSWPDGVWRRYKESDILGRQGNLWSGGRTDENAWKRFSCPGEYESS